MGIIAVKTIAKIENINANKPVMPINIAGIAKTANILCREFKSLKFFPLIFMFVCSFSKNVII